ncbi:unnamed protein product [Hermetia illucens]|uniref:Kazal-like domain-containing protein n=1 Tax=Hermetia illucens TaxID=343691 RepID=A0A7R8UJT9_HERIL|nr:unnamed protein product [Hermetia illucens]
MNINGVVLLGLMAVACGNSVQMDACQNICNVQQQVLSPVCVNEQGALRQFNSQCELATYNCRTGQMLVGRLGPCTTTMG